MSGIAGFHDSMLRLIVILVAVLGACARYEYINELDVPGLCANFQRPNGNSRVELIDSLMVSGSVVGTIVRDSLVPLQQATVTLEGTGRRPAVTNPKGAFEILDVEPGEHVLVTRAIGYEPRRDTVRMPVKGGIRVQAQLQVAVHDGPCSGFAAVRVRKPWWKLW